jgi:putative ABC transport system substrate-binding protein
MTTRRQVVFAAALGALSVRYGAAQTRSVRVGILLARPLNQSFYGPGIVRRLGELGYREGSSMLLEHRSADGIADRFPRLAAELIQANCDVIFAVGPEQPVRALQIAGSRVPVVFLAVDYDPLEKGVVTNLSKPDRNTTGVYIPQGLLAAKRLEILREMLPRARRFLVLSDIFSKDQIAAVRDAAEAANVQLTVIEFARSPYDFAAAFESAQQARVEGFIGLTSPVFATRSAELAELLNRYKLPGAGWTPAVMRAGFLIGYGEDSAKVSRRAADIGARILKGAKASDIPVEQADEFEFVINSTTARALGIKIPESVMARATRIVQ